MLKTIKTSLLAFCGLLTLSGCVSNDPIMKSMYRDIETNEVTDKVESYRVGWIAQGLLEPPTRKKIANELVGNTEYIQGQMTSNMGTALDLADGARFVTDLSSGMVNSAAGNQAFETVFLGAMALSLFMDGSLDLASGVYFPDNYNGEPLTTPEQATVAAEDFAVKRLIKAADAMGFDAVCEYSCEKLPSIWRLKKRAGTDLSQYIYAPDDIAVFVQALKMQAAGETQVFDSLATGFDVQWRTIYGYSAPMIWVMNPISDEQGKVLVDVVPDAQPGKMPFTFRGDQRLTRTDFGADLLKAYHATPFTFYGSSDGNVNAVWYNEKMYRFTSNSAPDSINQLIVN